MEGSICVLEIWKNGVVVAIDVEEIKDHFNITLNNTTLYGREVEAVELSEIYEMPEWKEDPTVGNLPEILIKERNINGVLLKKGTLICREFIQCKKEDFEEISKEYLEKAEGDNKWNELYLSLKNEKGEK